jgi:flagellar export protein FliJ
MQIEMMVADFERMATELDQQIEIEQTKTGISDVAHFAYSTFAKAALQRRDNLLASANDMRGKLESAQDQLAEALEDLKKVELLDQREHQRERDEQNKIEQAEFDEIARQRFRSR